eukprot:TRINITY_DN7321_c0_g5_i1.p1 TRINITY_DN7321_c0_g5~~TRINITY_DN7321_c0_g5_i1.p1  ORF type:complete len:108 (-),score=18.16 TRINITY_DN7321_c0_g5_i1:202-525(-)
MYETESTKEFGVTKNIYKKLSRETLTHKQTHRSSLESSCFKIRRDVLVRIPCHSDGIAYLSFLLVHNRLNRISAQEIIVKLTLQPFVNLPNNSDVIATNKIKAESSL